MRSFRRAATLRLLTAALLLTLAPSLLESTAAAAPSARNLDVVVVVGNGPYVELGRSVAAAEAFGASVMDGFLPITAPDLAFSLGRALRARDLGRRTRVFRQSSPRASSSTGSCSRTVPR